MLSSLAARTEIRLTRRALALVLPAVLLLVDGGCSSHESFVVLTLRAAPGSAPLMNVSEVRVTVDSGIKVNLVYPGNNETIDALRGKTLSVSFSEAHSSDVFFEVNVLTPTGCTKGEASTIIKKRAVTALAVTLDSACAPTGDGGTGDGPPDGPFPGCDPAAPALMCSANMTCHVNCNINQGMCTPAGTGGHGAACQNDNKNCMPGTQCFAYTSLGCDVTACLKFCRTNSDCSTATDGGVGNGAVCLGAVQCGGVSSGHRTCSFDCDPRGAATLGCPVGLKCFRVQGDMDQVDCLCPGPTRIKPEGADCPDASECAPGLICNEMSGTRKCRRLCKRSENSADCPTGQTCTMQAANNTYGVCL